MPVEVHEGQNGIYLEIQLSGKLTKEDYQQFVPVIQQRIKDQGQVRLLVSLKDFHGWTVAALWQDTKFDFSHFSDINRLAIVGETKWEAGMASFCKPFTTAKIKYFDQSDIAAAKSWIQE